MLQPRSSTMWGMTLFANAALSTLWLPVAGAAVCPNSENIETQLGKSLSPGSTISNTTLTAPRWSLYAAPTPAYVVNVAAEKDVATTVQYANKNNIPFLLQNQGNGWADTFSLGNCGILINIAGLNKITFNANATQATIQGGALTNDMIEAAYGNNSRFANPTCTCLGFLGYALGGGITREMGLYGTGVDQIISVNLVLASGQAVFVDATHHPDLFYAIRGAGANFGIVTSAVVKAYPVPKAQNVAWEGALTYTDDKLEALMQAILDLELAPDMEIDILFSTAKNVTSISAIPFYLGSTADAEKAFASILNLGPISNTATEVPYNHWGDFAASFCVKGERKPAYGASIARSGLNPKTWRAVYTNYKAFIAKYPDANASTVLAEYYPVQKAVTLGNGTSSYPFRDVPIHVVAIPQYDDEALDAAANAWGAEVRDLLRSTDGLERNSTYINFAHGDEDLETIYGDSLPRLQSLKKQYDPLNFFDQWFPLAGKRNPYW